MGIGNRNAVRSWMQMSWEDTPTMDKCHSILFFTGIVTGGKLSLLTC